MERLKLSNVREKWRQKKEISTEKKLRIKYLNLQYALISLAVKEFMVPLINL